MSEPFIGQIMLFAGNFAPVGWALCNGQTMSIAQNTALFSILGTTYGGNGTTTFALPDLQGRAAVGFGNGASLSSYVLGQSAGTETVTLTVGQMPAPVTLDPATVQLSGGSGPHPNIQPVLALTYIIALQGIFPSRS